MLKIRLQRFGKKNQPSFRVVVTESKNSTKSGKFLEILGFYNPKTKERGINAERAKHWIAHGTKLTGTVNNFFIQEGIIKGEKVDVAPRKKVTEAAPASQPASAPQGEATVSEEKTEEKKEEATATA